MSRQPIAIAVSGGVDSMVLTSLLLKNGFQFTGLHCNFNLREASNSDEQFVRKQFKKIDRPLLVQSFDTNKEKQPNETIQMAARRLRYEWFKEWQKETHGVVLMAHHLDDRIETFWLNVKRGTSIIGLQGIPEKNNGFLRPLLEVPKMLLTGYAQANEVQFVEDASNKYDHYERNWIRHHFVKELDTVSYEEWDAFFKRQSIINSWVESKLEQISRQMITKSESGVFVDKKLFELPWIWVYHVLKPYGLKRKHELLQQEFLSLERGKKIDFEGYEWLIEKEHIHILISRKAKKLEDVEIKEGKGEVRFGNCKIHYGFCERSEIDFTNDKMVYIDADKLVFPLLVRSFSPGDRIQPLGMQGQKKVSDLINELKVPSFEKGQVPVLVSKNQVVSVLPYRIAAHVKIDTQTTQIFFLRIQNLDL